MRNILLNLFFASVITGAYAKDLPGYYITLQGDTVKTEIKRGGLLSAFDSDYRTVTIRDNASGKPKALRPGEIKGYGFLFDSLYWHFLAKPAKSGENLFLRVAIIGRKASLYYYTRTNSGGYGVSVTAYLFTLENEKGEYLFVNDFGSLKKLKEKMAAFYKDSPTLLAFIDAVFNKGRDMGKDIAAVVDFANKPD
jgi:hypothetical protein